MLKKLHNQVQETASEFKQQFDAAWSNCVQADPGADTVLFARLKVLKETSKAVVLPLGLVNSTSSMASARSVEKAFNRFAAESGAKYDALAPSNYPSELVGPVHDHSGSLTYMSIGRLSEGVEMLIANGVNIVMEGGHTETLTPFRVIDRITKPEATGHRYVLVSVMVLNTGEPAADIEFHLADIARIRPDQRRNERRSERLSTAPGQLRR